jgi:hypothetical protein
MWRILGTIIEMFIHGSVCLLIAIIAVRIVGASLLSDSEYRMPKNTLGFSLILAAVFIGMAIILSTVIK